MPSEGTGPERLEFVVYNAEEGVATSASTVYSTVYSECVVMRLSDFKFDEYESLIGGGQCGPDKKNPKQFSY